MLSKRLQDMIGQLGPQEVEDPWERTGLGAGGKLLATGLGAVLGGHYGGAKGIKTAGSVLDKFSNSGKKREAERVKKIKASLNAEALKYDFQSADNKQNKFYNDMLMGQEKLKGERLSQKRTQQLIDSSKEADKVARTKVRLKQMNDASYDGGLTGTGKRGSGRSKKDSYAMPITEAPRTNADGQIVLGAKAETSVKGKADELVQGLRNRGIATVEGFKDIWMRGVDGGTPLKDTDEIRNMGQKQADLLVNEVSAKLVPLGVQQKMATQRHGFLQAKGLSDPEMKRQMPMSHVAGLEPDPKYGIGDRLVLAADKALKYGLQAGGAAIGYRGLGILGGLGGKMAGEAVYDYMDNPENPTLMDILSGPLKDLDALKSAKAKYLAEYGNKSIPGGNPPPLPQKLSADEEMDQMIMAEFHKSSGSFDAINQRLQPPQDESQWVGASGTIPGTPSTPSTPQSLLSEMDRIKMQGWEEACSRADKSWSTISDRVRNVQTQLQNAPSGNY